MNSKLKIAPIGKKFPSPSKASVTPTDASYSANYGGDEPPGGKKLTAEQGWRLSLIPGGQWKRGILLPFNCLPGGQD